jgi:hypothetical protein
MLLPAGDSADRPKSPSLGHSWPSDDGSCPGPSGPNALLEIPALAHSFGSPRPGWGTRPGRSRVARFGAVSWRPGPARPGPARCDPVNVTLAAGFSRRGRRNRDSRRAAAPARPAGSARASAARRHPGRNIPKNIRILKTDDRIPETDNEILKTDDEILQGFRTSSTIPFHSYESVQARVSQLRLVPYSA